MPSGHARYAGVQYAISAGYSAAQKVVAFLLTGRCRFAESHWPITAQMEEGQLRLDLKDVSLVIRLYCAGNLCDLGQEAIGDDIQMTAI
jgi:hypothetical protein